MASHRHRPASPNTNIFLYFLCCWTPSSHGRPPPPPPPSPTLGPPCVGCCCRIQVHRFVLRCAKSVVRLTHPYHPYVGGTTHDTFINFFSSSSFFYFFFFYHIACFHAPKGRPKRAHDGSIASTSNPIHFTPICSARKLLQGSFFITISPPIPLLYPFSDMKILAKRLRDWKLRIRK